MLPARTVVLGGARSGKSAFAERLVETYERPKVYIATAQAFDNEMQTRITLHQEQRFSDWRTVEAPLDVISALFETAAEHVVLLDCATLWLSNHMLADHDLSQESDRLLDALGRCPAGVVVVSNEVGFGIVPDTALGRRFRNEQGRLNQRLAAMADLAVLVVAGLPMVLKGALPKGVA